MTDQQHSVTLRSVDIARIVCALHNERDLAMHERKHAKEPAEIRQADYTVQELTDLIARMGKALLRAHEAELGLGTGQATNGQ